MVIKIFEIFWLCLLVFLFTQKVAIAYLLLLSVQKWKTVHIFEELTSVPGQEWLLSGACIVPGMGSALGIHSPCYQLVQSIC